MDLQFLQAFSLIQGSSHTCNTKELTIKVTLQYLPTDSPGLHRLCSSSAISAQSGTPSQIPSLETHWSTSQTRPLHSVKKRIRWPIPSVINDQTDIKEHNLPDAWFLVQFPCISQKQSSFTHSAMKVKIITTYIVLSGIEFYTTASL